MNRLICTVACVLCVMAAPALWAQDNIPNKPPLPPATNPSTRPAPKPISQQVTSGTSWLVKNQLDNGAWGQGDESQEMGLGQNLKSQPNVADTCMAVMALVRTGSTPKDGPYKDNVLKAISFVCSQIEAADEKSLYITELRSTRTQTKLGTYIDTFMAVQMLSELRKQMPDEATAKRVNTALEKALNKVETNQNDNGQWTNKGWAPALAQAQATKALNVAAQNGMAVDEKVREKAETFARGQYKDGQNVGGTVIGGGVGGAGDAGVALYSSGGEIASMRASDTTNAALREQFAATVAAPATMPSQIAAQSEAKAQLDRFDSNAADLAHAEDGVLAKMNDKQFISGFGSNGGEEFLSYLNIGESLFDKGGDSWTKWDQSITDDLNRIQNNDGSWSGHHCITGRTFCTSAALMVLTIDRAPTELAGKIHDPHK